MKNRHYKKGFSLIELIVTIAIIAALSIVVYAALNPAKRFMSARNARRTADTGSILSALQLYINSNNGNLPGVLTTTASGFTPFSGASGMAETQIGTATSGCGITSGGCNVTTQTSCVNLANTSNGLGSYLTANPVDPLSSTFNASKTGYTIKIDTAGIATIRACGAEDGVQIFIAR